MVLTIEVVLTIKVMSYEVVLTIGMVFTIERAYNRARTVSHLTSQVILKVIDSDF